MNWKDLFKKPQNRLEGGDAPQPDPQRPPENAMSCPKCGRQVSKKAVRAAFYTCPLCGAYMRVSPRQRIGMLADEGSFCELFTDVAPDPPFDFPEYGEKLASAAKKTGECDSVTAGECTIGGFHTVLFVMNGGFLMGSMGRAAGEKMARCFDYASRRSLPVLGVTISGGARMQEGIYSLMQMTKVSAAIRRHSDAGLLYVTLLTDPTTGGVSASLAMLGDITLAEPGALICFAGPRVIEQTFRQKLPEDFQLSEKLLEQGFVDAIAQRPRQREYIASILRLHEAPIV